MSDRAAWLEEWCPACRAAPGARCTQRWPRSSSTARPHPSALHVARGWRGRRCPACKAEPGRVLPDTDRTRGIADPYRQAATVAVGGVTLRRLGCTPAPGRHRRVVPFSGRAGQGGRTDTIRLSRLEGRELVDVDRWMFRDELAYALEAPVWDRYGTFAGHPLIRGTVTWTAADRRVVIAGRRGTEPFEEDQS